MRTIRDGQKGATLMELLVSMTISSIVMVALVGVTSMHISQVNRSNARSGLSVDMMLLSDYFSREIPSAGGELLPVWSGLVVENSCGARAAFPACNRTDRLNILNTTTTKACNVVSVPIFGTLAFDASSGTCCLQDIDPQSSQVVLTHVNDVAQRYVTSVNMATCTATVVRGPLAFNDNVADTAGGPRDWTGALMVPVRIRTFYLDQTTNELNRFTYRNGGGGVTDGSLSPIADRVLDFQIALGFDFDPPDGVIRDNADTTDEWLFNSPTGVETLGVGALTNASLRNLRMVAVGLILALPSATPNSFGGQTILNGPPLAAGNWTIERQVSNFMLRATRSYQ